MTGYENFYTHAYMVLDDVRTRALAEAIRRIVRPGDAVLDIGSGTGLLAVFAALAGASCVYAVEQASIVKLIPQLAAENGVSDRIVVLEGNFADFSSGCFPRKPRVVIGELLGCFAPCEGFTLRSAMLPPSLYRARSPYRPRTACERPPPRRAFWIASPGWRMCRLQV
ncbi:MAG: 50S ribosomal protein L11 methyltransferase [Acidobacteria bacterium]|nr:50S ribosomal protein L11 methyltransferase [Acidobacteriota bacterium]